MLTRKANKSKSVTSRSFEGRNQYCGSHWRRLADTSPTGKVETGMPKAKCPHSVWRSINDPEGFSSYCSICTSKRNAETASVVREEFSVTVADLERLFHEAAERTR